MTYSASEATSQTNNDGGAHEAADHDNNAGDCLTLNQGSEGTNIPAVVMDEKGLENEDVPATLAEEIVVDLFVPPLQSIEHFFVDADVEDEDLVEEVGGLEPHCTAP